MKNILVGLTVFLISIDLYAQHEEAEYTYFIEIDNPDNPNKSSVQTGFKIYGQRGIYTALHGIVGNTGKDGTIKIKAYTFKYGTSDVIQKFEKLEIVGVDVERDLVLLDNKNLNFSNIGFIVSPQIKNFNPQTKNVFTVFGFPQTLFLKANSVIVQDPPTLKLFALLNGKPNFLKIANEPNICPSLKQDVIQLGSGEILPGNSGSPIVNSSNQLVGVAHGGIDNTQTHQSISTFSIPWSSSLKVFEKSKIDKLINKVKFIDQSGLYSTTFEIPKNGFNVTDDAIYYNPFNFKKKYPTYIFGISWSRPVEMQTNGITVSTNLQDLNAALDITFDKRIYKFFYLGAYVSSRYLQYQMLEEFNYDLPLIADSYNLSTKKILDTYGFQASIIMFRGVLWHLYTGVGGFYNGDNSLENNYRGFVGFRKYMFHRQHISLDIKALYSSQNQSFRIPTLGNAQPIIQPFKQYYLCAGINYSFQSKN